MPMTTDFAFIASMDVAPDKEDLFNTVYDSEHIPYNLEVPGLVTVTRFQTVDLNLAVGGRVHAISREKRPKYTAIYELTRPEVLTSPEWASAVDRGRWPTEVRPYTSNREHFLLRVIR